MHTLQIPNQVTTSRTRSINLYKPNIILLFSIVHLYKLEKPQRIIIAEH